MAQWITRLTTNQEIAGSSPARLGFFLTTAVMKLISIKYKIKHSILKKVHLPLPKIHKNETG